MTTTTRRKLIPELIPKARELAALGLPLASIAAALGIHRCTLTEWRAEEPDLAAAIDAGRQEGEAALVQNLLQAARQGDTRAATWLLTHSPAWRDGWSDAAAVRREVERTMAQVVAAIEGCSALTVEHRRALFLALAARGVGDLPDPELPDAATA